MAELSKSTEIPQEEQGLASPIFVGIKQDIVEKQKVKYNVNGRDIVVFYHNQKFYAMDQHCYHAGGPLEEGDIEDVAGHWCIICPYHKHKITLDTGERLHFSFDPKDFKKPPKLCSKGTVQRIHQVQVVEDKVYVTLSDSKEYFPSDYFYSKRITKST